MPVAVNAVEVGLPVHRRLGVDRLGAFGFGKPFVPREWFFVPLSAINEAVERISDGSIVDYRYDPERNCLTRLADGSH